MTSRKSVILRKIGLALLLTGFASSIFGQKNLDVCRVTTHTRSISQGDGTGVFEIGKFPIDDLEEGADLTFSYERDELKYSVRAEVDYVYLKHAVEGKPIVINLLLHAKFANEKDTDNTVFPVEAQATYRYKFGSIAVGMDVVTGDLAQRFTLTCSDGISKHGVKRGEPKRLKKAKERGDN